MDSPGYAHAVESQLNGINRIKGNCIAGMKFLILFQVWIKRKTEVEVPHFVEDSFRRSDCCGRIHDESSIMRICFDISFIRLFCTLNLLICFWIYLAFWMQLISFQQD